MWNRIIVRAAVVEHGKTSVRLTYRWPSTRMLLLPFARRTYVWCTISVISQNIITQIWFFLWNLDESLSKKFLFIRLSSENVSLAMLSFIWKFILFFCQILRLADILLFFEFNIIKNRFKCYCHWRWYSILSK